MTLPSALNTLCDTLRSHLGVDVVLGAPEGGASAVYVWPWRVEEVVSLAHQRPPARPGALAAAGAARCQVHFLVLVQPACTLDGLSWLAQARQVLLAHPVLPAAGAEVVLSSLSIDQLTALFLAARLPLTVCISAVLRGV